MCVRVCVCVAGGLLILILDVKKDRQAISACFVCVCASVCLHTSIQYEHISMLTSVCALLNAHTHAQMYVCV